MNVQGKAYRTIWLDLENDKLVKIIDQRFLPHQFIISEIDSLHTMARAIREMWIRGAGLIGAAAAYGMYLACLEAVNTDNPIQTLQKAADQLIKTRPTAVNLTLAVERMLSELEANSNLQIMVDNARIMAQNIADEDAQNCRLIGENGVAVIEEISKKKGGNTVNILTHCNAGWLAFVDYGSALSPVYAAHDKGIRVHVWVDETRPRNQGAKLTAWELQEHGIPHTIIADNTGGHLMQHKMVDLLIVGCDRCTRQADAANKIGTYLKALAARDNDIPFYAALPSSSIDWNIRDGIKEIPIEQRDGHEIKYMDGFNKHGEWEEILVAPLESPAVNYGFDVTPSRLISGIITERGICKANEKSLLELFPEMSEEGIIKYQCHWEESILNQGPKLSSLISWRDKAYKHGFIGVYPNGIGYGNISIRVKNGFLISGSGTGHFEKTSPENYSLVEKWDIEQNQLWCAGPVQASSEALTHAVIYELLPQISTILHIHQKDLWEKYYSRIPATAKNIEYGTPQMAWAVRKLIKEIMSSVSGVFLLTGHQDRLVSYAQSFEQVFDQLSGLNLII